MEPSTDDTEPEAPRAPEPMSEAHDQQPARVDIGMRSLAPERESRTEDAMLGNRDTILDDRAHRTVGVLTNSGCMKADWSVRQMTETLLAEEFAAMPDGVRRSAESAARYIAGAIARTNDTLVSTAKEFEVYRGAEASLGLIHLIEDPATGEPMHAIIAQIGGGRIYRYRTRGLEQLTEDQTDVQGKPSGALGRKGRPAVVLEEDARPGDMLLILSEDLVRYLTETDILRACDGSGDDTAKASDAIARAARMKGAPGSLTAVAVRIPEAIART